MFSEIPWLAHGTSTRAFGSCRYPNANETEDPWRANRERFVTAFGLDPSKLVVSGNEHGGSVAPIVFGGGAGQTPGVDALVTAEPGIVLGIKSADCLPVFFVDPMRRVVGIAHAGWRGIVANIVPHTIEAMGSLGSHSTDLLVAIGPSIGPCHYEIHEERRDQIAAAVPLQVEGGSRPGFSRCDLFELARSQLIQSGIAPKHIAERPPCTACDPGRFSSYFLSKDKGQGMLSVIGIRG